MMDDDRDRTVFEEVPGLLGERRIVPLPPRPANSVLIGTCAECSAAVRWTLTGIGTRVPSQCGHAHATWTDALVTWSGLTGRVGCYEV